MYICVSDNGKADNTRFEKKSSNHTHTHTHTNIFDVCVYIYIYICMYDDDDDDMRPIVNNTKEYANAPLF